MTVTNHIPEDDLALFALAMLPVGDTAAVAAHLRSCKICSEAVGRLQGDMAAIALTSPVQTPPAATRERFLTAIAREPKFVADSSASRERDTRDPSAAGPRGDAPRRRSAAPAWAWTWAGWAVAAGLAATVGWRLHQESDLQRQIATQSLALDQLHRSEAEVARAREVLHTLTDPHAMQVTLQIPATPGTPAKPQGHAAYDQTRGSLVFVASNLQPVAPGRTYELWLLPATGNPVAAGLFRPDVKGNASVVLPVLPRNVAAKGFGVTEEDEGGSTSPTPPILLAGT